MMTCHTSSTDITGNIPGPTKGILRKSFERAILADSQTELISRLQKLNVGFNDMEKFIAN